MPKVRFRGGEEEKGRWQGTPTTGYRERKIGGLFSERGRVAVSPLKGKQSSIDATA